MNTFERLIDDKIYFKTSTYRYHSHAAKQADYVTKSIFLYKIFLTERRRLPHLEHTIFISKLKYCRYKRHTHKSRHTSCSYAISAFLSCSVTDFVSDCNDELRCFSCDSCSETKLNFSIYY